MSTLPKGRTIVVEPHGKFRWIVTGSHHLIGSTAPVLTLTVQGEGCSSVMQMSLVSRVFMAMDEYSQEHDEHKATLKPLDVRNAIEFAINQGWDPKAKQRFEPKGRVTFGDYEYRSVA